MDKRLFCIASVLLLFALIHINAEVDYDDYNDNGYDVNDADDIDDQTRQDRSLFLSKVNTSWFIAYKNFTATKLLKNTALLNTLLNSSTYPFKYKKMALLTSLTNATVGVLIPKANLTGLRLISKAQALKNSTFTLFNSSSILLNTILNAKLALKNSTFLAKETFLNASGLALQTFLNAKANSTATKLAYIYNTTGTYPWFLLKKNASLFWADELEDWQLAELAQMYNLTDWQTALLMERFNQTHLKSSDVDFYDDRDDEENETYLNNNYLDNDDLDTNGIDSGGMDNNEMGYGDQYQTEYELVYE